ncbi:breast carcinoma-amplified sequence 1 isoform X4 [Microcebus murinus]|uniref:breast carcinoma-amplified sequence 1 isoform X4 n=1 Tax=Microcebus murinus TaxID=30608 RepID=UPI003F6BCD6F
MFAFTVDLGISVRTDNAATSSPGTTETSAGADASGKNLGKAASPRAPAAQSRFFLTLSRPVPGRAGDRATDSCTAPVGLDVSPGGARADKGPSERPALPAAAAAGPGADKSQEPGPARDTAPDPAPTPQGAAPSRPRDPGFFDRLFKLDKGREQVPVDSLQGAERAEHRDELGAAPAVSGQAEDVPAGQGIADGEEKEGREIGTVSGSVPGDPEGPEIAKEDSQTAEIEDNNNPIMSFFKTLVSPNKAETKKDPEDTASKAESVCDGQAGQKTSESQAKGAKKKHLDSPRLGLAFRKFFRHKGAEKSPTTSADCKSDKANFTPQETQGAARNPKCSNPSGHVQSGTSTETVKEGAKEKSGPTSLPLGKLFWKKVVCESPVEIIKSTEVDSALQTVDLNEERDAPPEPAEVKLKREESKPPRTSLMAFLRQMTADSAEKATTPPEPEPAGAAQKGKEGSSKDKKPAAEGSKHKSSKQEAKDPAPCPGQATGDANSLQNGDKSQKRPEKRQQSLGGFFKGLGPKRMLDAQVQTDPVAIGPVGKSK